MFHRPVRPYFWFSNLGYETSALLSFLSFNVAPGPCLPHLPPFSLNLTRRPTTGIIPSILQLIIVNPEVNRIRNMYVNSNGSQRGS